MHKGVNADKARPCFLKWGKPITTSKIERLPARHPDRLDEKNLQALIPLSRTRTHRTDAQRLQTVVLTSALLTLPCSPTRLSPSHARLYAYPPPMLASTLIPLPCSPPRGPCTPPPSHPPYDLARTSRIPSLPPAPSNAAALRSAPSHHDSRRPSYQDRRMRGLRSEDEPEPSQLFTRGGGAY